MKVSGEYNGEYNGSVCYLSVPRFGLIFSTLKLCMRKGLDIF